MAGLDYAVDLYEEDRKCLKIDDVLCDVCERPLKYSIHLMKPI